MPNTTGILGKMCVASNATNVKGNNTMPVTYQELLQTVMPRPISSDRAYKRMLRQVEQLMRKQKRNRAEDDMIELLATLVEQYEIFQGCANPVLSPAKRLAGLMEARELTQTELSHRSRVPRTTINEILHSKRNVSKINAKRLASFFNVSIDEFIIDNMGSRQLRVRS